MQFLFAGSGDGWTGETVVFKLFEGLFRDNEVVRHDRPACLIT